MIDNIPQINLSKINALVLTSYIYSWYDDIALFWNYLSDIEKERAKNFVNNNLSDKYIISHGLLRFLLSIYTKNHPKNIYYKFNAFNKPYFENSMGIEFNISHSKDYIAFIISLKDQVGIDIEWKNPSVNIEKLKGVILNPLEINYFRTVSSKNKLEIFYNIWVKKEAIIKAIGEGCAYNIQNINTIASNNTQCSCHIYQGNKFYYSTLKKLQEYSMAISILGNTTNMVSYYEI